MSYEHIEIEINQTAKHYGLTCGDVFYRKKTELHTTIILCDGKGHGISANVAATMNVAYLSKLLKLGLSQRAAFYKLADFFARTGTNSQHYSVFTIARILNNGATTILSYEMPPPILVSPNNAKILPQRKIDLDGTNINAYETNCFIKNGEAIMLMSDGVTNAGIGRNYRNGWGSRNLCEFINSEIKNVAKIDYSKLSACIQEKVFGICHHNYDDDVTNLFAYSRNGSIATIFTGPPSNKNDDLNYIKKYITSEGIKIICGGTTAGIIAKILNRDIKIDTTSVSAFTPPQYKIQGIDLATEGAVTLNQLYNVMDGKRELMNENSPVTKLYDYLMKADKVVFYLGSFNSYEEQNIDFMQRGIKTRQQIVPLIAEKLKIIGKLVVIERI